MDKRVEYPANRYMEDIIFRTNINVPKDEIHIYSAGKKYIWFLLTGEIKEWKGLEELTELDPLARRLP
jgi:hypothetical protein